MRIGDGSVRPFAFGRVADDTREELKGAFHLLRILRVVAAQHALMQIHNRPANLRIGFLR